MEEVELAYQCLNLATEITKAIENNECESEANEELAELKTTLGVVRAVVVTFVGAAKSEAAFDVCLLSVQRALCGCLSSLRELDDILLDDGSPSDAATR